MKRVPMTYRPKEDFVQDDFGHHLWPTITNLLSSLIFFIVLLLPFVIIGLAMFYFHDWRIIHYMHFLIWFFGCWGIFFLIYIPLLSVLNNHRTEYLYHRHTASYNPLRLNHKIIWLHQYYLSKFGTDLHQKKIYTVAKDNNIPVDYIIEEYHKAGDDHD